jgi:predicted transcriptional regulator
MPRWKKAAYHLTEAEIRYAMANSTSNNQAAAFLHITAAAYKKYAEMYYDHASGKNLYELHKNKAGKKIQKMKYAQHIATMDDILSGKHPGYSIKKLKERLIDEAIFEDKCMICGFCEQRITDYKSPTNLVFKDSNPRNHLKDNLEIVCYNCFFLYYGDLSTKSFLRKAPKNIMEIKPNNGNRIEDRDDFAEFR